MSTLFIVAFILMIFGFILTFIGVIFYEKNIGEPSQPWWVWVLIFVGGILAVVGALITIYTLGSDSDPNNLSEIIENKQISNTKNGERNKEMSFKVYDYNN